MRTLRLFLVVLLAAGVAAAQQPRTPTRGIQAGNSYAISDIDNINLSNGNLMMNIPLAALPAGRGTDPGVAVTLRYDSKLWDTRGEYRSDGTGIPDLPGAEGPDYTRSLVVAGQFAGWKLDYGLHELVTKNRMDEEPDIPCMGPNSQGEDGWEKNQYIWRVEMRFPDGSIRELRPYGTGANVDYFKMGYFPVNIGGYWMDYYSNLPYSCGSDPHQITTGMNYYTADGSNMRVFFPYNDIESWTLYYPNGTVVENLPNDDPTLLMRQTDRNGNKITWKNGSWGSYSGIRIENEVGQLVLIGGGGVVQPGVNGEPLVTTIAGDETWVYRKYQATHAANANSGALYEYVDASIWNVTSITLPENLGQYQFTYNGAETQQSGTNYTDGFGELKSVELPSGATAEYQYELDDSELVPSACTPTMGFNASCNGAEDGFVIHNSVTQKDLTYDLEYDGSSTPTTETSVYSISAGGGSGTMTAPDGSITTQSGGYFSAAPTYAISVIRPDGTKTENIWAMNVAPKVPGFSGGTQFIGTNVYPKTEFTSIKDASGNYTLTAIKDFDYDKNGNVLEIREYDFVAYNLVPRDASGTGRPTGLPTSGLTLKRKTVNTYYYPTPIATDSTTDDPDHYANPSSPKFHNLIKSTELRDGSNVVKSRSEFYYDGGDTTPDYANLTETRVWDSTKGVVSTPLTTGAYGNSISSFAEYDSYGNVIETTDAKGTVTQITYGNITTPTGTVSGLYPTQTVAAYGTGLARTSSATYDFFTGLTTSTTDEDNDITNATEYDDLGRPVKVISADGTALESWTQTIYDDAARRVIVKSNLETVGDGKKVAIQHFDQLGRVRLSRTLEDSASEDPTEEADGIKVQTRFKTVSGYTYQLTSNPYRASVSTSETDATMGWTLSTAWSDGKRSETKSFTGAGLPSAFGGSNSTSTGIVRTDIDANRTLVTDQAGKQRISKTNALGQLKEIWEILAASETGSESVAFPNTSIAHGFKTTYNYDTLGKMVDVHQGDQHRYFMYDSLGRMLRVRQPEQEVNTSLNTSGNPDNNSWTAGFTYDNNGNVLTATDAKGTTITNTYDALNRVTQRSYDDNPETPTVTFTYDEYDHSKGQLTKVSSSISESKYTEFDVAGRLTETKQITDGNTYTSSYQYSLAGALTQETLPSGRVVKNSFSSNGDLSLVETKPSGGSFTNRASDFTYTADGRIKQLKLGNGLWETAQFNTRLQVTEFALGATQGGNNVWKANYDYGELQTNGTVDAAKNSGNIGRQTVSVAGASSFVQAYKYDSLNRLETATEMAATRVNYALASNGGTASASSEYSSSFPIAALNNGERKGTNWGSGGGWNDATEGSFPDWAQVEFNAAKTIDEIDVFTLQDAWASPSEPTEAMTFTDFGITSFDVQYWDGTAWATVTGGSVTGNDKVWRKFTFSPVSTTKIRVVVNGSPATLGYYSRITEIEAWGSTTPTQTWKQEFGYDRYGNRNFVTGSGHTTTLGTCPAAQCNPTIDTATNRFGGSQGYTFDKNGNIVVDAQGRQFIFNGDNKQILVKDASNAIIGEYFYDGEGKRVKKTSSSDSVIFIYDATGKLIEERDSSTGDLQTSYVYAGGRLLSTETSSGTSYLTNDHLGSPRINTNATGSVTARHDYHPFGEEIVRSGYGSDDIRKQFTGYERDNETNLDYAKARMFGYNHGRFTSPDPLLLSGRAENPQTWNRYPYVLNNPLKFTDPTGLSEQGGTTIRHERRLVRVSTDKIVTVTVTTDLSPKPDPGPTGQGIAGHVTRRNLIDGTDDKFFRFEINTRLTGEDGKDMNQSEFSQTTGSRNDDNTATEAVTDVHENPEVTVRQDNTEQKSDRNFRANITVGGVEKSIDYKVKTEGNSVRVSPDYENKIKIPGIPTVVGVPIKNNPDPIVESMRPKRIGVVLH